MTLTTPLPALQHQVSATSHADREAFDREGYAVGRGLFAPEVLREVRAPLIARLIEDGHLEPIDGDEDRFVWIGDAALFERAVYSNLLVERVEELLLMSGLAGRAITTLWGRRASIWEGTAWFAAFPGDPPRIHRDAWQMLGVGGPEAHFNFWCPLVSLGEHQGSLAIAEESHEIPEPEPELDTSRTMHRDFLVSPRTVPPPDVLEPRWRSTQFRIGDGALFRPDIVHATGANNSPFVRFAFVLRGQDAGTRLAPKAGLSLDAGRDLTTLEWLTLAIVAVQSISPWLARCLFAPRGIVGRLWDEPDEKLVDRSFVTLRARGLIELDDIRNGDERPYCRYHRVTRSGQRDAVAWLATDETNDPRLLAAKLLLCEWLDLDLSDLLSGRHEVLADSSQ